MSRNINGNSPVANGTPEKNSKKGVKKSTKIIIAVLGSLISCVVVLSVIAAGVLIAPHFIRVARYNNAGTLYAEGKYEEAYDAYVKLGNYKGAVFDAVRCRIGIVKTLIGEQKYDEASELLGKITSEAPETLYDDMYESIKECRYSIALGYMDENRLSEAKSILTDLGRYSESEEMLGKIRLSENLDDIKNCKVGDTIYFGAYEQDNDTENGKEDIAWKVLDKKNGRIFVTSCYVLDCRKYDGLYGKNWAECGMRTFLNETFFDDAFSLVEKKLIPTVSVVTENNPRDNTWGGNTVSDKVFLLSISELEKYFPYPESRKCSATKYAVSFDEHTYMTKYGSSPCIWWLRNAVYAKGSNNRDAYASTVNVNGLVDSDPTRYSSLYGYDYYTYYSTGHTLGVRPAMWITIGNVTESNAGSDIQQENMYTTGLYKVKVPTDSYLNLRSAPSLTSEVISGIFCDTVIEVTEIVYEAGSDAENAYWGKTEYLGFTGYVNMQYLEETYIEH